MTLNKNVLFAAAMVATTICVPAFAEQGPDSVVSTLNGGPISAPDRIAKRGDSTFEPSAEIATEDDQVIANFALDFALAGDPKRTERNGVGYLEGTFWNGSVKASIPIGSGKQPNIGFKNVGVDGALTFSINHYAPKFPSSESTNSYKNKMAANCAIYAGGEWIKDQAFRVDDNALSSQLRSFAKHYDKQMATNPLVPWEDYLVSWEGLKQGIQPIGEFQPTAEFQQVYEAILAECKPGSEGSPIGDNGGIVFYFQDNFPNDPVFMEYRKAVAPQSASFFGIEGTVGLSRFDVLDRSNFRTSDNDKVGFDINAHYGWIFNNADTSFRIGAGAARSFEPQENIQFCRTVVTTNSQECIEGQDGQPVRENTSYVEAGLRHVLSRKKDGSPSLAIAPVVSFDVKETDFQFEVPLYLQRSDKGGLDAGVRAIYSTRKDEFAFGVFVGIPFDLAAR